MTRAGFTDGVRATFDDLGSMLGAGVFLAIAPATARSGEWVLIAVVVAGLVAALGVRAGDERCPGWAMRLTPPIGVAARVLAAGAVAGCVGRYLMPAHPWYPTVAVLVLVAAAVSARLPGGPAAVAGRVATAVVVIVLVLVVITCFAIAGPGNGVVAPGLPGADDLAGLPTAAAVMVFAFGGASKSGRGRLLSIGVVAACGVVVAAAALRQLGGGRLAVATAPLSDAVVAAEGAIVVPIVLVGVVVAGLGVAYGAVRHTIEQLAADGVKRSAACWVCALVAMLLAVLLPTVTLIAAAACCLLLRWLVGHAAVLAAGRHARPWYEMGLAVAGVVLAAVLLAALPPVALGVAVAAAVVCEAPRFLKRPARRR